MALITSILTAGPNNHQTSSEEANWFSTNFITPGVIGSIANTSGVAPMTGAYACNAQGTPDKTVTFTLGNIVVATTPATQGLQNLITRCTANVTKTIVDNTSGATKYDWFYLVHDATKANAPGVNGDDVASIVVNRGTSNVSDSVGAPANSELLCVITVGNAFTTITNAQIADKRRVASAAIPDGSITAAKVAAGVPVQIVSTNYNAFATGTTILPYDDTIPQITEGNEFMTQQITPKSSTNRLFIEATCHISHSAAGTQDLVAALFQDSTANALAAANFTNPGGTGFVTCLKISHDMAAGTTSPTTFRVRAGAAQAGTTTFNGAFAGRKFGGITFSNIKITEYKV